MSLVQFEHVPDFPNSDVSDETAFTLEVMLLDGTMVAETHDTAEQQNYAYKCGHAAIRAAGVTFEWEEQRHAGFTHGVAAYEALATLVRPETPTYEYFAVMAHTADLLAQAEKGEMNVFTLIDARDAFISERPRTVELIRTAASLERLPISPDDAVMGAAIAWQLEKDILDSSSIV